MGLRALKTLSHRPSKVAQRSDASITPTDEAVSCIIRCRLTNTNPQLVLVHLRFEAATFVCLTTFPSTTDTTAAQTMFHHHKLIKTHITIFQHRFKRENLHFFTRRPVLLYHPLNSSHPKPAN